LATVVVTALLALTAACTSSNGSKDCTSSCHGDMKGSQYNIRVPKKWNGTLLIFSHGYVSPAGRAGPVAEISFEDTKGTGTDALSTTLLAEGYALAGSSY